METTLSRGPQIHGDESAIAMRFGAWLARANFTLLSGAAPQVGQRTAPLCFTLSSLSVLKLKNGYSEFEIKI
jgi:hypothetical protein